MVGSVAPFYRIATRFASFFKPYVLHVDVPADGKLPSGASTIQGWFLAPPHTSDFSLRLSGVQLTFVEVSRPDAQAFFGSRVRGFRAIVDLHAVAESVGSIGLELILDLLHRQ